MELNKKNLQKLTSLSDDELREKISAAAESAGIDRSRSSPYLNDIAGIKKTLLHALGEENVRKIKEGLDHGSGR